MLNFRDKFDTFMIQHQDDTNIDKNLKILCESENPYEFRLDNFVDEKGKQIQIKYRFEEFAYLMEREGLIRVKGSYCAVEKFGVNVYNSGGWLKYINTQEEKKTELELKSQDNEILDKEIKILQKGKLLHEETIREQNDRIRNLTEELKLMSLLQKYWWVIASCVVLGWSLAEILERI